MDSGTALTQHGGTAVAALTPHGGTAVAALTQHGGGTARPPVSFQELPARLDFAPLRAAHAVELSRALTDPRVYEFIEGPYPQTWPVLAAQIADFEAGPPPDRPDERWWDFLVRLGPDGPAIGRLEATLCGDWAEVAYLIGPDYWGRGYGGEALAWLHGQLWRDGAAATWWASVCPGNERSVRLLARLGYVEVRDGWPPLSSYDPGDRVFRRPAGPV